MEKICNKCGYIWLSFLEKPKKCPFCSTYHWYENYTHNCLDCGGYNIDYKKDQEAGMVVMKCMNCASHNIKANYIK